MKTAGRRRLMFWGAIGLLAVAAVVVALMPRAIAVDVATVTQGRMAVTLDHEGQTRVRERFAVSAPLAGRVLRVELEPGDRVARGETVLATLLPAAPALLDARARAEANSRVQAAEASLQQATAERERARAVSDFAASEARRNRSMLADGIVTREAAESADSSALVAARALQAAVAAERAAARDLDVAKAALTGSTSRPAAGAAAAIRVRSPIDGVVLRRLHESEAVVPQGEPLVEVADPAALEVIADFLSTDAVRIRPGMSVLIDRWGGSAPLNGRVRRVEPSAFLKVSALGVEEQRVWVVIEFADPRGAWDALGDGYRVEARVVTWQRDGVVQVPTGALFRHGEQWAVFRVEAGRARLREVAIGERNGLSAEVTGGLQAGDRVVVHPSDQVEDGARVAERSTQPQG